MDQQQLVISTKRFLAVLSPLLVDWQDLFQTFKSGLTQCQPTVIENCLEQLKDYQQKFHNLMRVRDQILKHAHQAGFKGTSLRLLIHEIDDENSVELVSELIQGEAQIRLLHRQLWSMWVIANRSQHSLSQMMDLFTRDHGSRELYNQRHQASGHGGLLLDAAV